MKLSQVTLLAATAATTLAAPADVTVTQHVHEEATVTVQPFLYVSNGVTQTSIITLGATTTANPLLDVLIKIEAKQSASIASAAAASAAAIAVTATVAPIKTSSVAGPSTTTLYGTTTSTFGSSTVQQTTKAATTTTPAASDFQSAMLNEHNAKRALHKNTPALSWSSDLASYAQKYADSYDCSGNLVHSGGPYGENLALGYGKSGSVDAWYNEISSYDFSNPGFSSSAGHFTQLVWKSSSQVGCGIKTCGGAWGDYVICSYQSAGNVIGQFPENVMNLV